MDGVLIDLLNAKWNTFVKAKFYKQFFTFAFYFIITLVCFTLRPGPPLARKAVPAQNNTNSSVLHSNGTILINMSSLLNYTIIINKGINAVPGDVTKCMFAFYDNISWKCFR